MEIKIVCGCGQKYIFTVDPENGQMPVSVNCPACGADGTKEANDILTQIFPEPPAEPPMAMPVPAPAAVAGGPGRIHPSLCLAATASAPPPMPAPRVIAAPKSPSSKPGLAWYEHVWAALPLCLVLVGGAIGGAIGG